MQQPHELGGVHPCCIGLEANLAEVDPDGFPNCPSIAIDYFADLSILVHEVAALSELALVLLVEDLAASRAIQLAISVGVPGTQFLDAVSEPASILVGTISFFHKVFAEFHLDLALARLVPL